MTKIKLWQTTLLVILGGFLYLYLPLFKGLLPIPSDALTGLYHPFRDLFAPEFPNGIPYKNFLLTDPVRQIIPWKELSFEVLSNFAFPIWNPYEMTGKPLLGNFQSSSFYPFNLLFFIRPFEYGWTAFIVAQQILAAFFMYIYLRSKDLDNWISIFAGYIFAFSGFMIAWLEWGTVGHTILWFPLILFTIEKILKGKNTKKYMGVYVFSLSVSFFAGHLQTFVYMYIISTAYYLLQLYGSKSSTNKRQILELLILNVLFIAITCIQWFPTLQYILLSARDLDQSMNTPGWFIPAQHLLQFVAPDFFGNPSTLNYWGVFNYAEFFGYVGIVPLLAALLTLGEKKKEIVFFQISALVSLLIAVDNPLSRSLFALEIPLITSTQPTRLIGIVSLSIIILSAYGLKMLSEKKMLKRTVIIVAGFALLFSGMWLAIQQNFFLIGAENLAITKRNIVLPTGIFIIGGASMIVLQVLRKNKLIQGCIIIVLIGMTSFALARSAAKFTPFSADEYFFPSTSAISFLTEDTSVFRIASVDDRLLAPNILTWYRLQSIDGYDPLYLKSYAKYVAATEREGVNIDPPYGFNRIITPKNYTSQLFDFLNTKYVISINEIEDEKLVKVFEEGQTKIYKNTKSFPRAYFVEEVKFAQSDEQIAKALKDGDLRTTAYTSEKIENTIFATGSAQITHYAENRIEIKTQNQGRAFLVLSDAHYPSWHVKVNGNEGTIHRVNINYRGVVLPEGKNTVIFYTSLF